MSASQNYMFQADDGMPPNMIDYLDRSRTAESTVWGKNPAFLAHALRRDGIVDGTKEQRLHTEPHQQVNRAGTSNDARKSFVESLHAEMNRETTSKHMDGVKHINREGTSANTEGHSFISEAWAQIVRDQTNPTTSKTATGQFA